MKKIKLVAVLVLVFTLGAVILQNRNPVQARFLLMTLEMPLILLLLLTAGLSFALGLLAGFFQQLQAQAVTWRAGPFAGREIFAPQDENVHLRGIFNHWSNGDRKTTFLDCGPNGPNWP